MLLRIMFFLLGVIVCSIGVTFIIIYLNLLNMGYSFWNYVNFIIRRLECLSFFIGITMIYLSSFKRKGKVK